MPSFFASVLRLYQSVTTFKYRPAFIPDLVSWDKVPRFLRKNSFILTGYRVHFNVHQSLDSVFRWTNETLNIWTHLVGFFVLYALLYQDTNLFRTSVGDRVLNSYLIVSYMLTMAFSVVYHAFNCVSESAFSECCRWDLSGVVLAFAASFVTCVYYVFRCNEAWRNIYLVMVVATSVMLLRLLVKTRNFLDPHEDKRRIIVFAIWVSLGVVPTIHWVVSEGGLSSPEVVIFLPKICLLYLMGALAFAFYLSKFPERYLPGRFDYVGQSHQIWHVLIVVSMLWWHYTVDQLAQYQLLHSCPAF